MQFAAACVQDHNTCVNLQMSAGTREGNNTQLEVEVPSLDTLEVVSEVVESAQTSESERVAKQL